MHKIITYFVLISLFNTVAYNHMFIFINMNNIKYYDMKVTFNILTYLENKYISYKVEY